MQQNQLTSVRDIVKRRQVSRQLSTLFRHFVLGTIINRRSFFNNEDLLENNEGLLKWIRMSDTRYEVCELCPHH